MNGSYTSTRISNPLPVLPLCNHDHGVNVSHTVSVVEWCSDVAVTPS